MGYKEKYEEALERARQIHNESKAQCFDVMTKVFPELGDNENDRIRQDIITTLSIGVSCKESALHPGAHTTLKEAIDWLEKQGEQVPTEKIEPKFKVGDWISHNTANFVFQVVSFGSCGYEVIIIDNHTYIISFANEDNYHLWTIQDAKDGDVLAAHECIVLFKEIDGLNIKCHCTYHFMNNPNFYVNTLQNKSAFHPATKEQRDLLFQEMKKAGYKWDDEKKELQEIEQKSTQETESFEPEHGKYYYCIKDYFCGGKKQSSKGDVIQALRGLPIMGLKDASEYFLPVNSIKYDSTWSREDEQNLNVALSYINDEYLRRWLKDVIYKKYEKHTECEWSQEDSYMLRQAIRCVNNSGKLEVSTEEIEYWLESLKDRLQPQPKQEWSVEDRSKIQRICIYLNEAKKYYADITEVRECIEWLKSLRPQNRCTYNPYKEVVESISEMCKHYDKVTDLQDFYDNVKVKCKDAKEYDSLFPQNTWKPSKEQMGALANACDGKILNLDYLNSLYQDLKKLREE